MIRAAYKNSGALDKLINIKSGKMQRAARMKKEIQMLSESPPHGISCWPKDDQIDHLEARNWFLSVKQSKSMNVFAPVVGVLEILGGEDTPFKNGLFKIEIQISERYPFEPPKVKFVTPIYHPNIDSGGRICLDTLKMPPKGAWKPCLNISTVLTSIQLLMAEPNPEDPLMTDISDEFQYNKSLYVQHAKEWTEKYAMPNKQIVSPDENQENTMLIKKQKSFVVDSDSNQNILKRSQPISDVTNKKMKS